MIGRTAGVDYGRKRIGLAVCDPLGITVTGLDTYVRTGSLEQAASGVASVLRERQVTRVVMGLPLHASGLESEMSAEARAFGALLGTSLGVEILFVDEGLTSWEAEEQVKASGKRLRRARESGQVDRAAAVSILRSWLLGLPSGPESPDPSPS